MKKIYTLACCIGLTLTATAQNYGSGMSTGTAEPYVYTNNGTTVLGIPAAEVLSPAQTIPFAWNFYGVAVTTYKASDNGYITFDAGASTSDPANGSIPNAGGPNDAIYAFWDDLGVTAGAGSPDEVVSFTYGAAPNRTHVIQYFSVTPISGTGFMYVAVRLHECGDFDIVHNYGNATGMTATVGCEDATGANGTMVQGPSFDYPALQPDGADDVVYTFYWDGINYDAAITSSDLTAFIPVGNNTISGQMTNNGSQAITAYDLHYTVDGGTAVTMNVTGVNIAALGGTANYSHSTPLNIASGGESHTVCVWADNLNGNADERSCNDEICTDVFSNNNTGATSVAVVLEEFTGAWCGWCPDGGVILDDLIAANPGQVIGVSIHDNDQMEYAEGIRSAFNVTAYPNGLVDRALFAGDPKESHSRGAWTANVATRLARYTPVEASVTHTYDPGTRLITATVTADFVDYAAGDMRFVCEITEDNVTGTGTGYDQVNYLNTTAGHPYEGAGDPIIGYNHRHVLRANPSGVYGNAGIIPAVVSPGAMYSETFTYTLPAGYDENEITVVGFVAYGTPTIGDREIMNADEAHLDEAALTENSLFAGFNVAPNPASGEFTLNIDLREAITADIIIYNMLGEVVGTIASGTYVAGQHTIQANTGDLTSGSYFVTIKTANASFSEKLIIR